MPRTPTRRRRSRWFTFLSALLFLCWYPYQHIDSTAKKTVQQVESHENYVIERVIDGDTFLLSNGEKVRLTGIDTPESRENTKAHKDSERSGKDIQELTKQGKEATRFVRELVEGKEVRLEYDVQKRDKYGRLLVYAYDISTLRNNPKLSLSKGIVVNANKEIFINGSIVGSGYAMPLTYPPNVKYADLFKTLYAEARSSRRGLWRP
ncbi:MAG: thermonuclease family protein [Candidatus Omnitrophica bacterium]|nr:thermonuclease family protein [Candidatus Omnitrophota bacterium]